MQHWKAGTNGKYYQSTPSGYPVLNWGSAVVREKMKDVVRFWLERGVDGFFLPFIEYLSRDADARTPVSQCVNAVWHRIAVCELQVSVRQRVHHNAYCCHTDALNPK